MSNAIAPSPDEVGRLEGKMKRVLRGSVYDLRLDLREDGLVLLGRAHSYYAKQLAQSYVMDSEGFDLACNLITVNYPESN
jgi:hypothetical protein